MSGPPPPPPPLLPPQIDDQLEQTTPIPADDARSDLLNAIRNFAGDKSKLKNIEKRKETAKKKKQEAKETGSMSIQDALKEALKARRGFIDGSKLDKDIKNEIKKEEKTSSNETNSEQKPVGLFDNISMMIPPPSQPDNEENNSDDDEWN
jgi:hypothetical protein